MTSILFCSVLSNVSLFTKNVTTRLYALGLSISERNGVAHVKKIECAEKEKKKKDFFKAMSNKMSKIGITPTSGVQFLKNYLQIWNLRRTKVMR